MILKCFIKDLLQERLCARALQNDGNCVATNLNHVAIRVQRVDASGKATPLSLH
jgi:hypothetical protein